MRKLVFAVAMFAVSGAAFAFCPENVDKIYARIQSHNVKAVTVSYSSDEAAWESKIKSGLEAKGITVSAVQVEGTGICKIRKS